MMQVPQILTMGDFFAKMAKSGTQDRHLWLKYSPPVGQGLGSQP